MKPINLPRPQETRQMTETANFAQNRTLTAFFDNRDEAESAIEALVNAGLPSDTIRMVPGNEQADDADTRQDTHRGFFEALSDFFMPKEDRHSYAEGLSRGGYLVTVRDL